MVKRTSGLKSQRANKSAKSMAKSALRAVHRLRNEREIKVANTVTSFQPTTTVPQVIHLSAVAQGVNDDQRVGEQVIAKRIIWRSTLLNNTSGSQSVQMVRFIFFKDLQQEDSSNPTATELFGTSSPSINTTFKHDNWSRFKILSDKTILLGENNSTTVPEQKNYNYNLSMHNSKIEYSGTSASNISRNGYYLMVLGNELTQGPVVAYDYQFLYSNP